MGKILSVLEVIAPIIVAVFLGVFARKKKMITSDENRGLQQFVMKYGLPCVLFNSCLDATVGAESLTSMALLLPMLLCSVFLGFYLRKKKFALHNLPQLFAAKETGMLGISLLVVLFGAENAYRMGVLDMTQTLTSIPVISILAVDAGDNPKPSAIVGKVFKSPLLLMSLAGLVLNLTGVRDWMYGLGVGQVLTAVTGFIAQPVSAAMMFSVGYSFCIDRNNRKTIFQISAIHLTMFLVAVAVIQAGLFLVPNVEPETRWAALLYCMLPGSYLAPGLGRKEEERTIASGVCSVLTVVCLVVFCIMAVLTA